MLRARKGLLSCVCMPIPTKTNIAASLIACTLVENPDGLSDSEYQKLVEGSAARVPLANRRQKTLTRQQVDGFWTKLVEEMHGKLDK